MIENRCDELTGRQQYREKKRLLRSSLMVLQVEVRVTGMQSTDLGRGGIDVEGVNFTYWRDAKAGDLQPLVRAGDQTPTRQQGPEAGITLLA